MTLDEKVAYVKGQPIRIPENMPNPLPQTTPMDTEWKKAIKSRWWQSQNTDLPEYVDPRMLDLRKLLLSFGGEEVCLPDFESDLSKILERGQLWCGDRIHMMKGEPCHCHSNSGSCWYEDRDNTVICTGYALTHDGMWRQHSWLVELRPRKNKIIETTVRRIAYFGFALNEQESWDFWRCNR